MCRCDLFTRAGRWAHAVPAFLGSGANLRQRWSKRLACSINQIKQVCLCCAFDFWMNRSLTVSVTAYSKGTSGPIRVYQSLLTPHPHSMKCFNAICLPTCIPVTDIGFLSHPHNPGYSSRSIQSKQHLNEMMTRTSSGIYYSSHFMFAKLNGNGGLLEAGLRVPGLEQHVIAADNCHPLSVRYILRLSIETFAQIVVRAVNRILVHQYLVLRRNLDTFEIRAFEVVPQSQGR